MESRSGSSPLNSAPGNEWVLGHMSWVGSRSTSYEFVRVREKLALANLSRDLLDACRQAYLQPLVVAERVHKPLYRRSGVIHLREVDCSRQSARRYPVFAPDRMGHR